MAEFSFLWKLILVFGRWNYIRIVEFILLYFYKNFLLAIPEILWAFFNLFSGSPIHEAK